jgi:hypothetical protein
MKGATIVIRNLVFIALIALTGTAMADVVAISFPELASYYETGWVDPEIAPAGRTTAFMFHPDVQSMDGLRLVISGNWNEGEIHCASLWGPPDTTSFTPGLSMFLTAPEAFDGTFHATVHPPDGPFDQSTATFEYLYPPDGADINLLLGVEVSVEFFCDLVLPGNCYVFADSHGSVTEVRLEAFGAVPVVGSSWGGVKSLFR